MGCCASDNTKIKSFSHDNARRASEIIEGGLDNNANDTKNTNNSNELPDNDLNTIQEASNNPPVTPIIPKIPIIKPGSKPVLNLKDKSDKEDEIERLISLHEEHLTIKGIYNKYASVKPNDNDNNPNDEIYMDRNDLAKALKYLGLQTAHLEPDEKNKIYTFFNLDIDHKIDNHDELSHYAQGYIDFFDFSSSLAALVSGDDDDATYIMFICIDHNNDGKLDIEDLAQLLLIENELLLMINHQDQITELSKERAKRHAKRLLRHCKEKTIRISQFEKESDFDDDKYITFNEYLSARAFKDDKKMGFDNNKSQEIPIDQL